MKAKMARNTRHHAKPVRKNVRRKKQAHGAGRVTKKVSTQPARREDEVMEGAFEGAIEFIDVDPEPVVDVFEVYETEGEEDEV